MAAFLDNCRFNPTLGGTTDWTYSSAVAGYQSPTAAGAVTTTVYEVFAIDASNNWEISRGACTITAGVPTFARTTVLYNSAGTGTATGQSGAGTKISFAAAPQVAVVAIKESLISVEESNSFTSTQKDRASTNLGTVRAIRVRGFIASGTYTPDANLLYAVIECVAGGGSGGGAAVGSATTSSAASGGGAGGFARRTVTAATIGASQTITIGAGGAAPAAGANNGNAGGTSSVGVLVSATGGAAGTGSSAATSGTNPGASGGLGSSGDLNVGGASGGAGIIISGFPAALSGFGGSGPYGGGGAQANNGAGQAGSGFGAGGSGAASFQANGNAAGGAGAPGLVIITEYCSQ